MVSKEALDDIPAVLLGGTDHGSDDGEIACAAIRSEATGDFLPEFHHASVALGLIVGEWNVGVGQEPQDVFFVITEAQRQIVADTPWWQAATGTAVTVQLDCQRRLALVKRRAWATIASWRRVISSMSRGPIGAP